MCLDTYMYVHVCMYLSIFVLSSASLTDIEEQRALRPGAIVYLLHWLHVLPGEELLSLNNKPMLIAWDLHLQHSSFSRPQILTFSWHCPMEFQMVTTVYRPIAFQDPLPLPSIPTWTSFCPPSCLHSLHLALIDKMFVLVSSTSSSPSLRNSTFDVPSSGNVFPLLFYLKRSLFRKVSLLNTLKWPSTLSSSLHLILCRITHILPPVSPLE